MTLIKLEDYRNKGVISALEKLLLLAKGGEIKALAIVAKFDKDDHRSYMAGDYKRQPAEALSATFMLERQIEKTILGSTGFRESM